MPTPAQILLAHRGRSCSIVPLRTSVDRVIPLDLSVANPSLTPAVFNNTLLFSDYISTALSQGKARYGIGGYLENREVYRRSPVFANPDAPAKPGRQDEYRTIHLGLDIWGAAGTPVFTPIGGRVHSFALNNTYGDYGATIIVEHEMEGLTCFSLYGHLGEADLETSIGKQLEPGDLVGHFGQPSENGNWPPHLHFQLILDLEGKLGDYPGVCSPSTLEHYRKNCPDPGLLLKLKPNAP